jgi:hypothetical protein
MVKKDDLTSVNLNLLRDTLLTFVARAGKGKDEVLQVMARETGAAIAALLKQPLNDLTKNHRLQVTVELVPKSKGDSSSHDHASRKPRPSRKSRPRATEKR